MEVINKQRSFEALSREGYNFNFEAYFTEGWRLFRLSPGPFVLYTIVVFVISFSIGLIPIVGAIAGAVIGPALTAGFYLGSRKLDRTSNLELGDFFKSFDFILQLFLFALVSGILVFLATLLLILPGIWLAVAISFGYPIIVFTKNDFWDAIKGSAKVITKKWFHFFGLFIILAIMNFFGAVFLFVGLLITVPLTYCVLYAAYKDIIGFADTAEPMDTADHLVGDND